MSESPRPAQVHAYGSIHPLRIKGRIGILTGGGDVPGLNPAIRAIFRRASQEGYEVVGIRRGWAGLIDLVREPDADNRDNVQTLSDELVS